MKMLEKNKLDLLVVEDEKDLREILSLNLSKQNLSSKMVESIAEAKEALLNNNFSICLSDLKLGDGSGLDLIQYIKEKHGAVLILIMTAYGSIETAIQALKMGAFDFLTKPMSLEHLNSVIRQALRTIEVNVQFSEVLIGESQIMKNLKLEINKMAKTQAPVHISGPSGSGKEKVARLIHALGSRHDQPFIAVNCGAIPKELMESEFFGYKKGSFTGAVQDHLGLLQAAHGGTLFLDEVADLSLDMQVKLLRVIQEKTVRSIGSTKEIPIDIRFLSATHRDLQGLVSDNLFRKDLFYRINVLEIKTPALDEHKEDLKILCEFIINKLNQQYSIQAPKHIEQSVLDLLKQYSFPGNVRELENILERAFTLTSERLITARGILLPNFQEKSKSLKFDFGSENLENFISNIEKKIIKEAMALSHGNKKKAAHLLGIGIKALRYKLGKDKKND
ncbi:MAG: sigma-54-dependent transcriptional regulator [Gammaproteobacteria bacterium]